MAKPIYTNIIALALGALAVLGFAPFYIFPATIISVAAMCYLWQNCISTRAAWILGFSYGLGLYCVGIYWIYIALHTFGEMPWWFAGFCTFCLCAFMALFVALVGYFSKHLGFALISIPVLWGLSDWVRSWIFTGFPWLTLGYSQVPRSPLAGFMPIVGVYGVSVMTVFLAVLITACFTKPHSVIWKRNALAAITLTLVAGGILKVVEWTSPIGKPFSVALVQGNIAQDIKWSPESAQGTIETYLSLTKASRAPLIILPETALPVIASQLDPSVKDIFSMHAKQNKGDILVGMVEYNEQTGEYFNSALNFGSAPTQTYRKNHLVPFGEFIPLKQVFGWIYRDWLNIPLSDLTRGGTSQPPINLGQEKLGVNICYEDVFGEEIIQNAAKATLLINISNDAWYGHSIAAYQHMQFSQARALETGRYMLRATNTGATAAIDQHGEVLAHAPHDVKTTLDVRAQSYTGTTPYVRWGNWPFILFSFGAIVFVLRRKTLSY
ncbi:MAG: apolipoprotein N-acyltransferase [Methylophilaceae bacterium]